jgi:glycosyltransferase involved in cell wall biosynthesis
MPSLYEGYGMALAEAMVRGMPIVATTGGAAAETLPTGAALKVAPGDASALRDALSRLIGDARLRTQLASAAWEAGQALPSWDDTARIVAGVLASIEGTSA